MKAAITGLELSAVSRLLAWGVRSGGTAMNGNERIEPLAPPPSQRTRETRDLLEKLKTKSEELIREACEIASKMRAISPRRDRNAAGS